MLIYDSIFCTFIVLTDEKKISEFNVLNRTLPTTKSKGFLHKVNHLEAILHGYSV